MCDFPDGACLTEILFCVPPEYACLTCKSLIYLHYAGGDSGREDGTDLLCEEDGTVTVRDSLDALLQVSYMPSPRSLL